MFAWLRSRLPRAGFRSKRGKLNLGDLGKLVRSGPAAWILAAPAIAALRRRFSHVTLFCHPQNLPLAEHLFPGLRALPVYLPHLDKEHGTDTQARERIELLRREVDLLICLRWDVQIQHLL